MRYYVNKGTFLNVTAENTIYMSFIMCDIAPGIGYENISEFI